MVQLRDLRLRARVRKPSDYSHLRLLAPAVAAVLLAGCGGGDDRPGLADLVPPDARAYVEVDRSTFELFVIPDIRDLAEPWAGERVALFWTETGSGVVYEVDDEEAARLHAENHPDAFALVAGRVVYGRDDLRRAARRAADGEALADTDAYREVDDRAQEDEGVALVSPDLLGDLARGHVTATVSRDGDELFADVEGLERPAREVPDLGAMPARALLAFASPDLGRDLAVLLRDREAQRELRRRFGIDAGAVLRAIGAGRVWVGEDEEGGLDATPKDTAVLLRQARAMLRHLRRRGERVKAYLPTALGRDDPFVQFFVAGDPELAVEVDDEILDVDVGPEEDVELLDRAPLYEAATRALGGPQSAFVDAGRLELSQLERVRFVAARDVGRGRQRIVVALR
jgi:hypothetical protein